MNTAALRVNGEWKRLLRHFELIDAPRHRVPGYLVLLVPDGRVAEACRKDLVAVLWESGAKVHVVKPSSPEGLAEVAAELRRLAVGEDVGAVWVECVVGDWEVDYERWRAGCQKAAVGLNRSRDTLLRQIQVPIVLVGAPWLMDVLIETAPDLWSVRTLVADVSVPSPDAGIQGVVRSPEEDGSPTVDPEFALRQAERYRGVAGRQGLFAELLTRAAAGFLARGDGVKALPLVKEATEVVRALGTGTRTARQNGVEAEILNDLAVLNRRLGRVEDAMVLLRRVEAFSEEVGDRLGLRRSYGNQALILQTWGRFDEAMALHKREEAICEELGDRAGLQASYSNQAFILQAWGRLDEAMTLLKKKEAICKEIGNLPGLLRSYGNQGILLQQWGRLDEAMALHKKQEALSEQLRDSAGLQSSYGNQAVILCAWERLDEAMDLLKKKEDLCQGLGDLSGLQKSYSNQAQILQVWGRLDEAMALLKKQEEICEQLGDRAGLAYTYANQAGVLKQMNRSAEAEPLLRRALEMFTDLGMPRERDRLRVLLERPTAE